MCLLFYVRWIIVNPMHLTKLFKSLCTLKFCKGISYVWNCIVLSLCLSMQTYQDMCVPYRNNNQRLVYIIQSRFTFYYEWVPLYFDLPRSLSSPPTLVANPLQGFAQYCKKGIVVWCYIIVRRTHLYVCFKYPEQFNTGCIILSSSKVKQKDKVVAVIN
jgi:hypothetical protein